MAAESLNVISPKNKNLQMMEISPQFTSISNFSLSYGSFSCFFCVCSNFPAFPATSLPSSAIQRQHWIPKSFGKKWDTTTLIMLHCVKLRTFQSSPNTPNRCERLWEVQFINMCKIYICAKLFFFRNIFFLQRSSWVVWHSLTPTRPLSRVLSPRATRKKSEAKCHIGNSVDEGEIRNLQQRSTVRMASTLKA